MPEPPPPQPVAAAAAPQATPPKVVPHGYTHSFVNQVPEHLVCIVCRLPCQDSCNTGCCGMICCLSCLEDVIKQNKPCSHCKNKEIFVGVKYDYRDQEVNNLYVYCTNRGKGCEWQGRLHSINDHLASGNADGCQFHEFPCPCDCGMILQRQFITAHVKTECPNYEVDCQYCHVNNKRHFIEGEHKEVCPKFPLACPNKCEVGRVFREDMENHKKYECPLEVIQCVYQNIGCTATMLRKDLEQHCNEKLIEHLKLELVNTKGQLGDALNQINELQTVMHRTNGAMHVAITSLRSVLEWSNKLVAMATMCESGGLLCPVILKMPEFSRKKRNGEEWFSVSFFSHDQGYKMHLNVDANGYGDSRGTHMSVWLCLAKGPHDDNLTWPLRGRFEIQVLNQVKDKRHHAMIIVYGDEIPDNYAGRITGKDKADVVGEDSFISHEDLYNNTTNCQFLKDDCVYFKITKQ